MIWVTIQIQELLDLGNDLDTRIKKREKGTIQILLSFFIYHKQVG